jgi:hypothetical protein
MIYSVIPLKKVDIQAVFYSAIYSIITYSIYVFWKYRNNITIIEEWNLFGSQKTFEIIEKFYSTSIFTSFTEVHYYLIPEAIIDYLIDLIVQDDVFFWKIKLIYRMTIVMFPLIILFRLFRLPFILDLLLPVYLISTQSLTKINWDLGSAYSLVLFAVLMIFSLSDFKTGKKTIFIFAFLFTYPATINPPSFLAATFCFLLFVLMAKCTRKIRLYNSINIVSFLLFHFSLLILFWSVNRNKLEENIVLFSTLSPPTPGITDLILYFQGFGLWWGDQGYENGTPYYSSFESLLKPDVVFLRFASLFMIIIVFLISLSNFYLKNQANARSNSHLSHKLDFLFYFVILVCLIPIFVLASNIFDFWGWLNDLSMLSKAFREPDRKFLQIYSLLIFILIGFSLKLSFGFLKFLNMSLVILLIAVSLLRTFNSSDRAKEEYYPSPSNEVMTMLSKDFFNLNQMVSKDPELCLLGSGAKSTDYLIRNLMISNYGGRVHSNFDNSSSIPVCSREQYIYIVVTPPGAPKYTVSNPQRNSNRCKNLSLNLIDVLINCELVSSVKIPTPIYDPFYNSYVSSSTQEHFFEFTIYNFAS